MYSFLAAIAASSSLLVPHNASALASAAAKSFAFASAALSAVKFTSTTFTSATASDNPATSSFNVAASGVNCMLHAICAPFGGSSSLSSSPSP